MTFFEIKGSKLSIVISSLKVGLLSLICAFPIFIHLEKIPIRIWDESRLCINAYEMLKNNNWLITYFEGKPDMWNTKPPLMIWMQVLCSKIFGYSELAMRLPSAIAAFLLVLFLSYFAKRYLKNFWFGLITCIVLVTSYGFINVHGTRTGDYDSLLCLFLVVYSLSYFLYLEQKNKRDLIFFFIALILAVMTKSIQGLLFLPALFIYTLIDKKFFIFKDLNVYKGIALFVFTIGAYYLLREMYNPGYINAVWENELGGRYMNTVEEHTGEFLFYYNMLLKHHFKEWIWLVPIGFIIGISFRNILFRKLTYFSALISLSYWLIISISKTKLEWYEIPLFPFLAMLIAMGIFGIFYYLLIEPKLKTIFLFPVMSFLFLFSLSFVPYTKMVDKVYLPKEYPWDDEFYQLSYYLKHALNKLEETRAYNICYDGYHAHILFYLNQLNDLGQQIGFKDWVFLEKGDLIIASQSNVKQYIEQYYIYELLSENKTIKKYRIIDLKC